MVFIAIAHSSRSGELVYKNILLLRQGNRKFVFVRISCDRLVWNQKVEKVEETQNSAVILPSEETLSPIPFCHDHKMDETLKGKLIEILDRSDLNVTTGMLVFLNFVFLSCSTIARMHKRAKHNLSLYNCKRI